MIRTAVSLALLLTALFRVSWADLRSEKLSLKKRHDPFYIGPSLSLTGKDAFFPGSSTASAILAAEYAWDTGTALQLQIPAVLVDSTPGTSVPRIGAGANNRVELDGLFRAWGDSYDYLAFSLGAGFPWQSSAANQKSHLDSWLLILSVFGRVDWDWLAIEGAIEDSPWFPSRLQTDMSTRYSDTSNSVSFAATAYFYPKLKWLSPFLHYTEIFPSEVEISTVAPGGYFPVNQTHSGRTRSLGLGSEFAPTELPALLRIEFSYIPVTPVTSDTEYSIQGSIRWLF